MGRSSCGLAAAARHAAAAAKDEGAQKELMSAVVDEARRQALAVETVMADVMRAKGKSVLDSTDDPQEQVCDAPLSPFRSRPAYRSMQSLLGVYCLRPLLSLLLRYRWLRQTPLT